MACLIPKLRYLLCGRCSRKLVIEDVLGDAVDDNVLNAWGQAYWFLADVLKARETSLYAAAA